MIVDVLTGCEDIGHELGPPLAKRPGLALGYIDRAAHGSLAFIAYGHGPEYRIEGTTKGNRVRMRNMDTGKLTYTRSLFSYQFVRLSGETS